LKACPSSCNFQKRKQKTIKGTIKTLSSKIALLTNEQNYVLLPEFDRNNENFELV